ncbi:hypothetical protein H0H93_003678 [Arthromyces matolae]|nr:hypothetical protein H0H93_003678 [Arthromyces matolae]
MNAISSGSAGSEDEPMSCKSSNDCQPANPVDTHKPPSTPSRTLAPVSLLHTSMSTTTILLPDTLVGQWVTRVQILNSGDKGKTVISMTQWPAKGFPGIDMAADAIPNKILKKLVEKTEKEGKEKEQVKENMAFSFAQVRMVDKDSLEEVEDIDQGDSWAQTLLQRITEERDNVQMQGVAQSGLGVKRCAAAVYIQGI